MNERENVEGKSDCYSDGERDWMEFGQRIRAVALKPLLVLLTKLKITPDSVTLLAGIIGLGFVPAWWLGHRTIALLLLLAHVLLDGLDGPLARDQNVASSRGSFTDTFADQIVVTAVTITWMVSSPTRLNIAAGSVYVFVYALVVAMAMVRNALDVPYSWLVRPRFFVYLAITMDNWRTGNMTLIVLTVCDVLLTWKCLTGFLALRSKLPGPDDSSSV